ncbi:MAG: succinate dehydrogenase transmembrane subunit [Cenarchaeum symbiont of Oopsacas minuta]|nr:succinate dehydrogenase transmembrane subunit [Cenarchaeum symbiont of Oopsacas minuta]
MENASENNEGIRGMANPRRYGIERIAYLLMRITGLGLLVYFVGHIYETSNILQGKVGWDGMLAMTQTVEGHVLLTIIIGMCVFHTANGIRILLGYGGLGMGKPMRPDYPYTPMSQSVRHKIGIYSSIVLAAVAMLYGLSVMFGE